MIYVVEDGKGEIVVLPSGAGAMFLTEDEATKVMIGHPEYVLRKKGRIWS